MATLIKIEVNRPAVTSLGNAPAACVISDFAPTGEVAQVATTSFNSQKAQNTTEGQLSEEYRVQRVLMNIDVVESISSFTNNS